MEHLLAARHAVITKANTGPAANIMAWFMIVSAALAVITRVMIRVVTRVGKFSSDDLAVIGALLLNVAQVVVVSEAVDSGLGITDKSEGLSLDGTLDIEKYQYILDIFYFAILFLSKYAILALLMRLGTRRDYFRNACIAAVVFAASWMVAGIFAVAFQCGSMGVWLTRDSSASCMDRKTFWIVMEVFNILSEILIVSFPAWLVWGLRMRWTRKIVVVAAFLFRLSVIGAIVGRLVEILAYSSSPRGPRVVGSNTGCTIATTCVIGLAIISACTPVLKPFLEAFDSGVLGAALPMESVTGSRSRYARGSANNSSKNNHQDPVMSARRRGPDAEARLMDEQGPPLQRSSSATDSLGLHEERWPS